MVHTAILETRRKHSPVLSLHTLSVHSAMTSFQRINFSAPWSI